MSDERGLFLFFILIFTGSCSTVPPQTPTVKELLYKQPIPIDIRSKSNVDTQMFIDGVVDGQKVVFSLDTGAAETQVTKSTFFDKYPIMDSYKMSDFCLKNDICSISVKEISLHGVPLPITTVLRLPEVSRREGLLGIDAFKNRIWVFDFYDGHNARLSFEESFPEELVPFKLHQSATGLIIIKTKLADEVDAQLVFDTGASRTVVTPELVSKYPKFFRFIGRSSIVDAHGKASPENNYVLKSLRLGKLFLKNIPVSTFKSQVHHQNTEDDYDIIFGAREMQNLRWVFDLKREIWSVW